MRLVKTHSHTSEPQGREAGKVRNKLVKGRPSLEAQEQIVKENHRHVTRDGGGGRGRYMGKRKLVSPQEEK